MKKAYIFQDDGFCTGIIVSGRREKSRFFSEDATSVARELYRNGIRKQEHYYFSLPPEDVELNQNFTLIKPDFLSKENEKRFRRSLAHMKRY